MKEANLPGRLSDLKKLTERIPAWLPTGVLICAILWLTLAPHPLGDMEPPLFPGADKIAHAVMFGALAAAIMFDLARKPWHSLRPAVAASAAAAASAAGIAIEFAQQSMQAGRCLEGADMVADATGAILAAALWLAIQAWISRRLKR